MLIRDSACCHRLPFVQVEMVAVRLPEEVEKLTREQAKAALAATGRPASKSR